MLVISRKPLESFYLTLEDGREIKITVIDATGQVRIGILADKSINIRREELSKLKRE